jgi:hypothetical protein
MKPISIDRQKLINDSIPDKIFLCVKEDIKYGKEHPSFWYGNGSKFSILRGSNDIEINKEKTEYYNNYNNKVKLIAKIENTVQIKEASFWRIADIDNIPENLLEKALEKRLYYVGEISNEYFVKNNNDIICYLLEDILERGSFDRNFLM